MQGQDRPSAADFNHVPFLTPSQLSQRLRQYEQEFADRYSKKDDYYRYANRVKKAPVPVIKPWPPLSYKNRFNFRKEAVLHRHRSAQRGNRNRAPYHRSVHSRLGRFGKPQGQSHIPPAPSLPLSPPPFPGEVPELCLTQELLGGPEIELEVSGSEDAGRDLTEETSSCYLSDEGGTHENAITAPSPLSQYSFSSHENPQASLSPLCEPHPRSPFSPGTGTGSDTPGESKTFLSRVSPSLSGSFTPDTPTPLVPCSRSDQQGPKRVNLANLSSIQCPNGQKLKKSSRSSSGSGNLFSNILASNDYSLDRPKQSFLDRQDHKPPPLGPDTKTEPLSPEPEESGPLLVSLPLQQVKMSGQRGRSAGKRSKKEPIAPVKIKLTGQTWQLESCHK